MAPVRESGTAIAAVGGALWDADAATCGGPLPFPVLFPPALLLLLLLPGVEVAAGLGGDRLAALGGGRTPFGSAAAGAASAAAAGSESESVAPLDLDLVVPVVPEEDEDEDGDEDIGAWSWSGRG